MDTQEALSYYSLGGVKYITPIHIGYIHETYKIEMDSGMYILQKVSPIFKPEVMEDISAALNHLKKHGLKTMEIISTNTGKLYVLDNDSFWRLYTYISGKNFEKAHHKDIAYEAGWLLGRYHQVLNTNFHHTFKHIRLVKHNIPLLYEKYRKIIEQKSHPDIDPMTPIINRMLEYDLPRCLRRLVGHGDTKLTNFIFTETEPYKARVIVDFDDVGNHSTLLYELGSAFRSWCSVEKNGKYTFSLEYFQAAFEGHFTGSENLLESREKHLIPQGIKIQCLQLASRFVRDFFEQSYFRYDPEKFQSQKQHCVEHAKECLDLFSDVDKKEKEILEIIKQKAASY